MKHILFVISGLGAGGAERVVAQLASHWVEQGHRVSIATFDGPDRESYHPIAREVALHRLGAHRGKTPFARKFAKLTDLWWLRRTIAREQPDVVISFLTKNNLLALLATIGSPARVICCERNNPERQQAHSFWNRALAIAYRRASLIICQTRAVRRCMPKRVQDRIAVIPNPISAWPVKRSSTHPPTVTAVGRLTHQKGFDLLIDAFALAHREAGEDWHLDIWGDGPDRPSLENRIRDAGMSGKITLSGESRKPGKWVENADIFVLSSRYEGFPNVLGEAMAAGLPVISTRCDFGPEEMISDGQDGLLAQAEDAADLARAMASLMADAQLRAQLGKAAASSVSRFAPSQVLGQWDQALDLAFDKALPASNSGQASLPSITGSIS